MFCADGGDYGLLDDDVSNGCDYDVDDIAGFSEDEDYDGNGGALVDDYDDDDGHDDEDVDFDDDYSDEDEDEQHAFILW